MQTCMPLESAARLRATCARLRGLLLTMSVIGAAGLALSAAPALAEPASSTPIVLSSEELREAMFAAEVLPMLMEPQAPNAVPAGLVLAELAVLEKVEEREPIGEAASMATARIAPLADPPPPPGFSAWKNAIVRINELAQKLPESEKGNLSFALSNVYAWSVGDLWAPAEELRNIADSVLMKGGLSAEDAVVWKRIKIEAGNLITAAMNGYNGPRFDPNWIDNPPAVPADSPVPVLMDMARDAALHPDFAAVAPLDYADSGAAPEPVILGDADPELRAAVAAVAPDPANGVNANWGQVRPLNAAAASEIERVGAQAAQNAAAVGAGAPAAPAQAVQQALRQELNGAVGKQALSEGVTDASKVLKPAEQAAGKAAAGGLDVLAGIGLDTVLDVAASAVDPAMLTLLAIQAPQIITSLINQISGTPSTEELILQQLVAIQHEIKELSEQVRGGFALVDANLQAIDVTLNRDSELLENANQHIDQLSNEMAQVVDKLDQIQADIYRVAATQREENFQQALNTDLGYSVRTEGAELPLYQFEQAAGLFYTWGALDPFNAISELPREDWSREPDQIFAQLGNSTASNALNFNLDFLIAYADENEWSPQQLDPSLPNPEVWAAGASAFSQLLMENRPNAKQVQRAQLGELESVGSELQSATRELTANGAAQVGDGVTFYTGSGLFNHALANYLQQGVENRNSLLNRIQAEENYFLSTEDPGGKADASCEACSLGIKPSGVPGDNGAALIDPWGGAEQAPSASSSLTGFESTSEAEPSGAPGKRGEMSVCPSRDTSLTEPEAHEQVGLAPAGGALTDPLPNVFANAWHLGLGNLTTCYAAQWKGTETFGGNLELEVNWLWNGALVMRLRLYIPNDSHTNILGEPDANPFCTGTGIPPANANTYVQIELQGSEGQGCQSLFPQVLEGAVKRLAGLKPPQTLGEPLLLLPNEPKCKEILGLEFLFDTCSAEFKSPEASVTSGVERKLLELQAEIYRDIAPPENANALNSGNEDVQAAANSLSGARALVDDYIELGLPLSMSEDPQLRSLVLGGEKSGVEDEAEVNTGTAPKHLLDNSQPDFELYDFYRNAEVAVRTKLSINQWKEFAACEVGQLFEYEGLLYACIKAYVPYNPLTDKGPPPEHNALEDTQPPPKNTESWEKVSVPAPPASDPAKRRGLLEAVMKKRAIALAAQLMHDISETRAEGSEGETDPLIGATIARVAATSTGVETPPESTKIPEVIGTPAVGETLTCAQGEWKGSQPLSFGYTWLRDGSTIASGPTYMVGLADVGHGLACEVTAENGAGEGSATSGSVNVRPNPAFTIEKTQEIKGSGAGFTKNELTGQSGQTVLYRITVKNTGNVPLKLSNFTDASCANLSGGPGLVEVGPGESSTWRCERTLEQTSTDFNEASVEGVPAEGDGFPLTHASNVVVAYGPTPAPTVETGEATELGQRTAVVNAAVDPRGGSVTACKFEYGTTTVGSSASCVKLPGSGTSAVAVSAPLKGLAPNTTYRFRISASNAAGTSKGAESTFKTLAAAAPSVETTTASEVLQRAATLNGTVDPNGAEITTCKFEYGTSSLASSVSCAKLPGSGTSAVAVSAPLKGLSPNATYRFRISATSLSGTSKGTEGTFKTIVAFAPTVQTGEAVEVLQRTATVTGTVNPNGGEVSSCSFEYGTTSFGSHASCAALPGSGTAAVPVSAQLKGLSPGTTYRYRVSATSPSGTSKGGEGTFETTPAQAPTVVTMSATELTEHTAVLNATVDPNGSEVTACNFEYGTTSFGSRVPCSKLPGLGTTPVGVSAPLKALAAGATYRFRITATSLSGTSKGAELTLKTSMPSGPQTFGKTTVGGSSDTSASERKRVNRYELPIPGSVTKLSIYLAPSGTPGEQLLRGVIYSDQSGSPSALLGESEQLTFKSTDSAGWYELSFAKPIKLPAGNYWIGDITGATSKVAGYRYDSVSRSRDYNTNAYSSGPSNPFGSFTTDSEQMSLYATYTPE